MTYPRPVNLSYLPMHKKYRSHFEIIALLLEAVRGDGAARFSIMKQASINCVQLKKYLKPLNEMGFLQLEMKDGRIVYKASEKGLEFLRQYYVLLGMLLTTYGGSKMNQPLANAIPVAQRNS